MTDVSYADPADYGHESPQIKEKARQIKAVYMELAREFTERLNAKGISGSIIQFSVHDRPLDEITDWLDANAAVALGWWTCPPDCVCCGLGGRFLTANPGTPAG